MSSLPLCVGRVVTTPYGQGHIKAIRADGIIEVQLNYGVGYLNQRIVKAKVSTAPPAYAAQYQAYTFQQAPLAALQPTTVAAPAPLAKAPESKSFLETLKQAFLPAAVEQPKPLPQATVVQQGVPQQQFVATRSLSFVPPSAASFVGGAPSYRALPPQGFPQPLPVAGQPAGPLPQLTEVQRPAPGHHLPPGQLFPQPVMRSLSYTPAPLPGAPQPFPTLQAGPASFVQSRPPVPQQFPVAATPAATQVPHPTPAYFPTQQFPVAGTPKPIALPGAQAATPVAPQMAVATRALPGAPGPVPQGFAFRPSYTAPAPQGFFPPQGFPQGYPAPQGFRGPAPFPQGFPQGVPQGFPQGFRPVPFPQGAAPAPRQ